MSIFTKETVVDGKTGLMTPDDGTTLKATLEALKRNISSRRRVIVSFTLDGEKVDADNLGAKSDLPPGKFGLLEVRTADPFQFSVGTLTGLLDRLEAKSLIRRERSAEDRRWRRRRGDRSGRLRCRRRRLRSCRPPDAAAA